MEPEIAEDILRLVGADRIKRSSGGDFLHFCCPLAPYKSDHAHNYDKKPSAWVSLDNYEPKFGCWTCSDKAQPFVDVVEQLNVLGNGRFAQAVKLARENIKSSGRKKHRRIYIPPDVTTDYETNYENHNQLPNDFLTTKGITKRTTYQAFRLGVDPQQGLLLFPIITRGQVIVGAQARQVMSPREGGSKYFSFYPGTAKTHHLYGEHLLDLTKTVTPSGHVIWEFRGKAIIVFEGPMDVLHAYDVGVRNVVALMGAKVSVEQAKLLAQLAGNKPIFFVLDADIAGRKGALKSVNETFLDVAPNADVRICSTDVDPKLLSLDDFKTLLTKEEMQWRRKPIKDLLREMLGAGRSKKR